MTTYQYIKLIGNRIVANDYHHENTAQLMRDCFNYTNKRNSRRLNNWLNGGWLRKHYIRFDWPGHSVIITPYKPRWKRGKQGPTQ